MHYKWPKITHLDQVRRVIDGREEFIIAERDDFYVVNYLVRKEDTFPPVTSDDDALLRECRGLIFDKNGQVLSRAYHKFFNVNEVEETQVGKIDLGKPHVILDKLDGSFIRPILIDGIHVRLASKMGITGVAMMAEEVIADKPGYMDLIRGCIMTNSTPIFEFVSRRQRVVVDYPDENLILTGVRNNTLGTYMPYEKMIKLEEGYGIPVVKAIATSSQGNLASILEDIRSRKGIEGVVIRFDDGHQVKIKTEEYVTMHKAKDAVAFEKDVVAAIINEKIDDVISVVPDDVSARLHEFCEKFWEGIDRTESEIMLMFDGMYLSTCKSDRKKFAIHMQENGVDPLYRSILFMVIDGLSPLEAILKIIGKNLSSQSKIDRVKHLYGSTRWTYVNGGDG